MMLNVDETHNGFSKQQQELKVEKILKGSLHSMPSPSPLVKIQLWVGKFAWGVKANAEGEGDGIESWLSS